ncbi:MAG: isochorismatase family protein [Solirubrobacterales bacterium]
MIDGADPGGGEDPLVEALRERLAAERSRLAADGIGTRGGAGHRPALLVVDLIRAFTEPDSPLGSDLDAVVARSAELIALARRAGVPIFFSVPVAEAGGWSRKIPANDLLLPGTRAVELDPRLGSCVADTVFTKTYPSCFFATDLATRLTHLGVDTLLIAGAGTSGCIRATAVDACSHGLRTIVVADAVGDRSPISHEVSLSDLALKYADVVTGAEAASLLAATVAA